MVDRAAQLRNAGFKLDLQRFAAQLDIGVDQAKRRLALDVFNRLILGTPVDTGRARASWFIENGAQDLTSVADEGKRTEAQATSESLSRSSRISGGGDLATPIWMTNNLPYIIPLEFGHSQKAPAGWVRIALADIEAQAKAILLG